MVVVMARTSGAYGIGRNSRMEAAMDTQVGPDVEHVRGDDQRNRPVEHDPREPNPDQSSEALAGHEPQRAATSCTAEASGRHTGAVHSRPKPNRAPTCE